MRDLVAAIFLWATVAWLGLFVAFFFLSPFIVRDVPRAANSHFHPSKAAASSGEATDPH